MCRRETFGTNLILEVLALPFGPGTLQIRKYIFFDFVNISLSWLSIFSIILVKPFRQQAKTSLLMSISFRLLKIIFYYFSFTCLFIKIMNINHALVDILKTWLFIYKIICKTLNPSKVYRFIYYPPPIRFPIPSNPSLNISLKFLILILRMECF